MQQQEVVFGMHDAAASFGMHQHWYGYSSRRVILIERIPDPLEGGCISPDHQQHLHANRRAASGVYSVHAGGRARKWACMQVGVYARWACGVHASGRACRWVCMQVGCGVCMQMGGYMSRGHVTPGGGGEGGCTFGV